MVVRDSGPLERRRAEYTMKLNEHCNKLVQLVNAHRGSPRLEGHGGGPGPAFHPPMPQAGGAGAGGGGPGASRPIVHAASMDCLSSCWR